MTKKKLLVKFLFGSVVMMLTLVLSVNVNALSSEEIFTRILVNNFQYCYQNALTSEILAKNYSGFNSLMNDGFKNTGTTQNGIRIPDLNDSYNKITTQSSGDKGRLTSCYALLYKDAYGTGLNGEMKGLLDIYNVDVPAGGGNIDLTRGLLADKLKYDISTEQASSNEYCYTAYVRPKTTVDSSVSLGTYCRNEDNYPITINDKIVFTGGDENSKYVATGKYINQESHTVVASNPVQITITSTEEKCVPDEYARSQVYCSATIAYPSTVPTEGVKNATSNVLYWINQPDIYVEVTKKATVGDDSRNLLFRKNNSSWKEALSAITGGAYTDEVPFSDAEKYAFYKQYLTTYYKMDGVPVESSVCQADKPSVLADVANAKYYIFVKNSGWCLANLAENKVGQTHPMTVFTNDQRYRLNSVINTLSELINLMGELDYGNMEEIPDVDPESPVVDPDNPTEVTCASSGAAESLGWIVCPIMMWLGNASNNLYNYYVEPALNIKPALFDESPGENNDIRDAWGVFQNIANIVFVILFLVVIISQLTGFGIDNYGIKKILPKLIIAAILVNLSYYICLIFIDLSNIVGNGVQSMFDALGSSLEINDSGELNIGAQIGSTTLTAVPILVALIAAGVAVWQNPAILLSVLVAALGVVVSVFFLFLILSAREAAIVVLTVISPLAFVCYMLPNTKNLFDRWRKMGEGLLLVYPICGLLVGGGSYVSKLILAAGVGAENSGFFGAFSAMLISIVPIFFIPTVLKSSFAAMGNLGAKISGFGERLRSGATRGARNTNTYKQAQERGLERRTRIRAGISRDGKVNENISGFRRFMSGGKRGMARSRAEYLRNQDARNREESLMGVGFDAAMIGQEKKAERDSLADYMTLINDKTRNGEDESTLFSMYDNYLSSGNKAGAVAVARIAGRRKDTAARFINQKITGSGLDAEKTRELTNRNSANSSIFRSVAKEISTGENSGNYRESNPFGFEFAAQHNRNANTDVSYGKWVGQNADGTKGAGNIHSAFENHITNSKELVGMKNSSLQELLNYRNQMSDEDKIRLQRLADETINNRATTGVWDTTKAENIYKLAGREAEYRSMFNPDGSTDATVSASNISGGDIRNAGDANVAGAATAGETFMVRGQHGDVTFTQGNDGQWRDENGRVVEDFDRFRRGIDEFRANRNNSQNGNNANAGQNNSQPQNPQP